MKIRGEGRKAEKIEPQMAPMIDVVFQLLIFFMLTLKIVEPEGSFNINMPIGAPSQSDPDQVFPPIKVRLLANSDGSLGQLMVGQTPLGNDASAFDRLNSQVVSMIGSPGSSFAEDIEVEIDPDYNLDFEHVISAVSACTGRLGEQGQIIRYVEKIKFAPPREPGA